MERQRVQARLAGVTSISHTLLHHQFIVSVCANRAATEVSPILYNCLLYTRSHSAGHITNPYIVLT